MIEGSRILLRPIQERDWALLEAWGERRAGLWGRFQRFQLDHLPLLRRAYAQTSLLSRESGFLLIETRLDRQVIGFVRYTLIPYPDSDLPHPEIGFGLPEASVQGKGYAKEALQLLVDYLFAGYPCERISAFTDPENLPARRVMESLGFQCEGALRRALFRDGEWRDVALYGLLRREWPGSLRPG
jgi:RimJ/RimL family protein N-acetyltransferase